MFEYPRQLYGFRFSVTDGLVLVTGVIGTWLLFRAEMPLWWVVPMAVGHFFLFCNVFRVRRLFELIWAACFVVNVCFWLYRLSTHWMPPLLTQLPVTLAVITLEILSPRYHGILARRINRRLPEYLQSRTQSSPLP